MLKANKGDTPRKGSKGSGSVAMFISSHENDASLNSGSVATETVVSKEEMFEMLKEADPDGMSKGSSHSQVLVAPSESAKGDFNFEEEDWFDNQPGKTNGAIKQKNALSKVQDKISNPEGSLEKKMKKKRIKVKVGDMGSVCSSVSGSVAGSVDSKVLEAMKGSGRKRMSVKDLEALGVKVPTRGRSKNSTEEKSTVRSSRSKSRPRSRDEDAEKSTRSKSRPRSSDDGETRSRARSKSRPRSDPEKSTRARSKSRPRSSDDDGETRSRARSKSRPRSSREGDGDDDVKSRSSKSRSRAGREEKKESSDSKSRSRSKSRPRSSDDKSRARSKSRGRPSSNAEEDMQDMQIPMEIKIEIEGGEEEPKNNLVRKMSITSTASDNRRHALPTMASLKKEQTAIKEETCVSPPVSPAKSKKVKDSSTRTGRKSDRNDDKHETRSRAKSTSSRAKSTRSRAKSKSRRPEPVELEDDSDSSSVLPPVPMQIVCSGAEDAVPPPDFEETPTISGNSDDMFRKIKSAGITQEQFLALAEAGLTIAEG
jgi:hypothetical protein